MDLIREVVSTQYAFPAGIVVLVISCAILVFVFGFKSAEEPPFDQLSFTNDDRKPAGKKRKLKDKKTQSNGHATTVKEKSLKTAAEPESSKTSKQSPKQQPKDGLKEQAKKKDPAPQLPQQQQKEKASASKKPAASTPKQATPKKSTKDAQEAQKKIKKQEKVDDNDGWEQVGKKNRKGSPPVSQDEKEKSNSGSPVKEKKGKKPVENEKVFSEPKEGSPKAVKEKVSPEVKEVSSKPPKEKVSAAAAVEEKPTAVKENKDSPKKSPAAKDNSKSPEKKATVTKNVVPEPQPTEFKIEEKKEKKKKTAESTSFIENEKSAMKGEGKIETSSEKVEAPVFDELGDVWTEKVPKKSKKKVRKE